MKRSAFTLIETAVAIALLSLVLLWSINAYANISKGSKSVEDISIASALASNQIENLKKFNYSDLKSEISAHSSSITPFASPYTNYGYKYVEHLSEDKDSANFYLKYLTVEIYKISDTTNSIIQMDCSFLRTKSDGKNIGL